MGGLFSSRLGVILIFGAVLLALDAGRSIWARFALAVPTTEYRPDPAKVRENRGFRGQGGGGTRLALTP